MRRGSIPFMKEFKPSGPEYFFDVAEMNDGSIEFNLYYLNLKQDSSPKQIGTASFKSKSEFIAWFDKQRGEIQVPFGFEDATSEIERGQV